MSFGSDMEQGAGLRGMRRYAMGGGNDVPDADKGEQFWFWCNGCSTHHRYITKWTRQEREDAAKEGRKAPLPTWTWNGSIDRPTFSPSLLYTWTDHVDCNPPDFCRTPNCTNGKKRVCHLFVTDGQARYLSDCTHALAGKTVPVEAPV